MDHDEQKVIRVGSRKSELALIQTKYVISHLQNVFPNKKFEIHTMSTIGDRVLNISLPKIGEKSLFTRDLEDALRNGGVDFVVHSLKDLPTALPTGMAIGAVLKREDARDALVLREEFSGCSMATLPLGSVIGTSSLRRTAQIKRQYPNLTVCDIRGNLNTRLAKLDVPDSKFAGIILAQAGLVRMGWMHRISQVLEPTEFLYAVGQGALAVECRANDDEILSMLQKLMCLTTTCTILAERSFLKTLGGGCSAPVAVWSKLNGDVCDANGNEEVGLSLVGSVWSLDGATEIRDKLACSLTIENTDNNEINANNLSGVDENSNDQPPIKRSRPSDSPPIINDDADVESYSTTYDVKELIEKHIDLAKKCPVVGLSAQATHIDENGEIIIERGGGDADRSTIQCPLHIDVGQEFMGQCPVVNKDAKIFMANAGKCPFTSNAEKSRDEPDVKATTSAHLQCPFNGALQKLSENNVNTLSEMPPFPSGSEPIHLKCPFLQKNVQMFDYADEEKPQPNKSPVLLKDVDNLFCGMFQHECHSRELYVRSNELGRQLAEKLIKKGAMDVMKRAQAEIHSKT